MFTITASQLKTFGIESTKDFVQRTTAFLREHTPAWAAPQSDDAISDHIRKTIDACARIGIRQEINVQKVLFHSIRTSNDPFAEGPLLNVLTTEGLTESRRVMKFIKYLREHGGN